jgi:hypothetical protein
MSEVNKPLAAGMLAMAETALSSKERLAYFQNALKLDPHNAAILKEIVALQSQVNEAVCYVAIEKAIVIGSDQTKIEGGIYLLQSDRSLKPLTGAELLTFSKEQPNFVKNWRLEND